MLGGPTELCALPCGPAGGVGPPSREVVYEG